MSKYNYDNICDAVPSFTQAAHGTCMADQNLLVVNDISHGDGV